MVVLKSPTNWRPRMAVIASTLERIKSDPLACLGGEQRIRQIFIDAGHVWRERVLDPVTTFGLFIRQVLHGNTAINHLRFLTDVRVAASSYCDARKRLPVAALAAVVESVCRDSSRYIQDEAAWCGRRVFVADATSSCTPDTPALQKLWPQPSAQKEGCGFPTIKLLGLLNLATGMILHVALMCLNVHEMSQLPGLNAMLQSGDVLLGDRGLCSFWHLAILLKSSVDAVFRMHQRQIVDFTPNRPHRRKPGKSFKRGTPTSRYLRQLGHEDHVVQWVKPAAKPDWMSAADYASLPDAVEIRELRYRIIAKGYRTRVVTIATTLLDPLRYPKREIVRLYGLRWEVETDFRHLKTTMKMEQLKCKDVDGVVRELIVFVLVYNMIRAAMTLAAERQKADPNRVSFIDAVRWLISLCPPPTRSTREMDLIVNPRRPGRWNARVIKKRIKPYDLMNRPRHEYIQPNTESEDTD
jgi:hypothetical protein